MRRSSILHLLSPIFILTAGCSTLSGDPLSPPHVRRAACATKHVEAAMEEKLSPEYQAWLSDVKHFWRDTQHEFADEYHRNEVWPRPYSVLAAHAVRQPLDIQAENARQQLSTLWDYHFEVATGKLNTMGRKRLEDIVNQAGSLGHTVFVQRSSNAAETELRVADTRNNIQQMDLGDISFDVVEARSNPSVVSGDEAQRAIKLLTNPQKSLGAPGAPGSPGGTGSANTSGGGQ